MKLVFLFAASLITVFSTNLLAQESPERNDDCGFFDFECKTIRINERADAPRREREETQRKWREMHDPQWREKEALEKLPLEERINIRNERVEKENARRLEVQEQSRKEYEMRQDARRVQEEEIRLQRVQRARDAAEKRAQEQAREEAVQLAAERADRADVKRQQATEHARKERCGADYKNPQIGMRIERVQDCIAPVKMTSQLNRADGVVSQYTYRGIWFSVMSGHVVAWGK